MHDLRQESILDIQMRKRKNAETETGRIRTGSPAGVGLGERKPALALQELLLLFVLLRRNPSIRLNPVEVVQHHI